MIFARLVPMEDAIAELAPEVSPDKKMEVRWLRGFLRALVRFCESEPGFAARWSGFLRDWRQHSDGIESPS